MRYSVVLHWDEEAQVWVAVVPAMDDSATSGETVEEALEMAKDLIGLRIADHLGHDEPLPTEPLPVQLHHVEVPAPAVESAPAD